MYGSSCLVIALPTLYMYIILNNEEQIGFRSSIVLAQLFIHHNLTCHAIYKFYTVAPRLYS